MLGVAMGVKKICVWLGIVGVCSGSYGSVRKSYESVCDHIKVCKITQQSCGQWNCIQWSCAQTQTFVPVLVKKRWLKKVFREWEFGFSLGSYKVVLGRSTYNYLSLTPLLHPTSWSNMKFSKQFRILVLYILLSRFWSLFSFYTIWKHRKAFRFLLFSRGIK